MSEGRVIRGLVAEGRARVLAVVCPDVAEQIRVAHGLKDQAAKICAEGVVATLLLSAHVKGEERLMVQVQGQKPRFGFHGEARSDGSVRARMSPTWMPWIDEVEGALLAIKWDADRELYRGAAELGRSFEASLQNYLVQSQQSTGVVRLRATLDDDGRVKEASGLLVELLGGHWEASDFEAWVEPLREADLTETMTGFAFAQVLGSEVQVLEARRVTLLRTTVERVEGMLRALGSAELLAMAEDPGRAEVTCQFTNETFVVAAERLRELAAVDADD